MKKRIVGFVFILVASIMMIAVQANANSSYTCSGGVIQIGDSAYEVKRRCNVVDKEKIEQSSVQYWTVTGKFKGEAVLSIQKGKVVDIDQ